MHSWKWTSEAWVKDKVTRVGAKAAKTMWANIAKNQLNVELAEKYQIVKNVKTAQNAKSKFATNTWVNILEIIKNNRAKSKKITVEVYMVGAEIKEIVVEQQAASATTLTGPPNTKNDVDVETAKKTTLNTNTEAF